MMSVAISGSRWGFSYGPVDDLQSLALYLQRIVSPSITAPINVQTGVPANGDPLFHTKPLEEDFTRPAVTVQLVDDTASTYSPSDASARRRSYNAQHSFVITSYGDPDAAIGGRADTIRIADLVWRALNEGATNEMGAYRPQLWSFAMSAMLARRMRVVRTSLSMGLVDTDDQNKWLRPLSCRVICPRVRPLPPPVAIIEKISVSF
jgi:hypothetical protein